MQDRNNSRMVLNIAFADNNVIVDAVVEFPNDTAPSELTFMLNKNAKISEFYVNGIKSGWNVKEICWPQFRPSSQIIEVTNCECIYKLNITYSIKGDELNGWTNCITDAIKSLNWYSAWFPQEFSVPIIEDLVQISNAENLYLVKGIYDEKTKTWEYGSRGYDPYNIMLYDRSQLKIISTAYMNIYYIDENIKNNCEAASEIYQKIIGFYNGDLFEKRTLPVLDIACASPIITDGGAYRRRDLMWCPSLHDNLLDLTYLLAHETAHIWCTGADCNSWEDWLNETTAEWASLLYAIKTDNKELFDLIIKPKLEAAENLPAIKTADGSRPNGVHDKGTAMLYKLYKLYGEDVITYIVRSFADLKNKTTNELIKELRCKYKEAADYIENQIIS